MFKTDKLNNLNFIIHVPLQSQKQLKAMYLLVFPKSNIYCRQMISYSQLKENILV
jgi:hypothetical protein